MLFYLNSESLMVTCLSTYIVIWMQKQLVISKRRIDYENEGCRCSSSYGSIQI